MKISELQGEVKELALLRQIECMAFDSDKKTDDIKNAFDWWRTDEGTDYWLDWHRKEYVIKKHKTDKEEITDIIQKKIDIMEMRKFPNYNLAIGILKDLIREIK